MQLYDGRIANGNWYIDKFYSSKNLEENLQKKGWSVKEARESFASDYLGGRWIGENVFLTVGVTAMWDLFSGSSSYTVFDYSHSRLGTGIGTATAAASQTALTSGAWYQQVDSSYPSVLGSSITYRITIAGGNDNVSMQEFGLDNNAVSGTATTAIPPYGGSYALFDRLVSNQGTKISGQTWVISLQLSVQ